jgi:hypothetical protein
MELLNLIFLALEFQLVSAFNGYDQCPVENVCRHLEPFDASPINVHNVASECTVVFDFEGNVFTRDIPSKRNTLSVEVGMMGQKTKARYDTSR